MNKEITIAGKKISYRSEGKGKPVLLVHGFGEDGNVWSNQLSVLKNNYHVIIPDLPASGKSEMVDDMSMEGMAEVLHAIIHAEALDRCTVLGHSMGGYIMLAFAEKYWNHLNGFGLIHSSAFADTEEKKAARRKGIEFINREGAFEFLKSATPKLFSPFTKEKNPALIETFVNSLRYFDPKALVAYYNAMINRADKTEVLRKSNTPVLFIMGKHDEAIPLADGLKQCHLPVISDLHILENSGHLGMLEEADRTNTIIMNFLQLLSV